MRRFIIGMLVTAVGVMMLLRKMGIANFDWFFEFDWHYYFWPIVVIFAGVMILLGGRNQKANVEKNVTPEMKEGDVFKSSNMCSGAKYNFAGQNFGGAKIDVAMGGCTLDLRGAKIADNCVIKVSTMMGGVDIVADANVNFNVQSSCFMGGVDNKRSLCSLPDAKTIIVKAECFMGGVDIK